MILRIRKNKNDIEINQLPYLSNVEEPRSMDMDRKKPGSTISTSTSFRGNQLLTTNLSCGIITLKTLSD
ncbi:MAG: hypothetical protein ABI091_10070 [Ferruginibacter sp.]